MSSVLSLHNMDSKVSLVRIFGLIETFILVIEFFREGGRP